MTYLVTGAAGFIGFHTCLRLLGQGEPVVGLDNINDYYDPALKEARLAILNQQAGFTFHKVDLADREAMAGVAVHHPDITRIIHLAAQAGVRYSLVNPYAYTRSNIEGHLVMLEFARRLQRCEHFVYASSSSVYGTNTKLPFSVDDRVDTPVSLYAATKKANELMAHSYSHLFQIPTTGLRFFTVYGPWGRPDMSAFLFVKAILAGQPIHVFNGGDMRRDFTYIDDIVSGVLAVAAGAPHGDGTPYRLYNIGNHQSEPLMRFIGLIEQALGRKAEIILEPMQPGDVKETFADIEAIERDYGFAPTTTIEQGIPRFVQWYREYHKI
ncbi:NAD-dependent epimerase/dehydratase family protein [Telmatospirillum sp.]|uniref:NAD-dependent epimerase/dehydratase family protein n=1 Tax=Telmatospirillum sp. TaxID=2079197 RepID=UPI00284CEF40|nr:NAD-dependent epimerase/dehydratase family protein [Telmatospirillum sp.]MDR3437496.1 NAD-dependent epimerase/dehydratase family protein [Telmatospirillum sp.]